MCLYGSNRWLVYFLFVILVIASIIVVEALDNRQKAFLHDRLIDRAQEEIAMVRSGIEAELISDIYIANSFAAIELDEKELEFSGWDLMTSSVMRKSGHIKSISLAPNDVIQFVYPRSAVDKIKGLDLRTIPEQWAGVIRARQVQDTVLTPPIDLVGGGRALIARIPIFSDPPFNFNYWGVCSIVLSLESLFEAVEFEKIDAKYHIAIRRHESAEDVGTIFYGDHTIFDNAFSTETVHLPYGSWQIAAAEKTGLLAQVPWYRVHAARLIGYPVILFLMLSYVVILWLYNVATRRSLHDELTQIPNRRYFLLSVNRFFDRAKNEREFCRFAVFNVDLDKFKSINDNHGHAAGDAVLIEVANRLMEAVMPSGVVARVGGDEFLLLLPREGQYVDIDSAKQVLWQAVCYKPIVYRDLKIPIHISLGGAEYDPRFGCVTEMLNAADADMYLQKKGRELCQLKPSFVTSG